MLHPVKWTMKSKRYRQWPDTDILMVSGYLISLGNVLRYMIERL